jgi:hypothetical protein
LEEVMKRFLMVAALLLTQAACYHATVRNLGPAPGGQFFEKWSHSWVYGLVPPADVDAAAVCGGRDASVVETQLSFVNGLVGVLTFGIYTPMTITVRCS